MKFEKRFRSSLSIQNMKLPSFQKVFLFASIGVCVCGRATREEVMCGARIRRNQVSEMIGARHPPPPEQSRSGSTCDDDDATSVCVACPVVFATSDVPHTSPLRQWLRLGIFTQHFGIYGIVTWLSTKMVTLSMDFIITTNSLSSLKEQSPHHNLFTSTMYGCLTVLLQDN